MSTINLGAIRPQFLVNRYANFKDTVTLGAVALEEIFHVETSLTGINLSPDTNGTLTLTPKSVPTLTLTPDPDATLTLTPL